MRRKLAVLLTAVFVSSLGATACGGVQQEVENRAREEINKGRQHVEKRAQEEIEKGRKQVEKRAREEIEKRAQEGRKQVEKRTQ